MRVPGCYSMASLSWASSRRSAVIVSAIFAELVSGQIGQNEEFFLVQKAKYVSNYDGFSWINSKQNYREKNARKIGEQKASPFRPLFHTMLTQFIMFSRISTINAKCILLSNIIPQVMLIPKQANYYNGFCDWNHNSMFFDRVFICHWWLWTENNV